MLAFSRCAPQADFAACHLSQKSVFEQLMEALKDESFGQISHILYDTGDKYRRNMQGHVIPPRLGRVSGISAAPTRAPRCFPVGSAGGG
jgi:hypothetical protein